MVKKVEQGRIYCLTSPGPCTVTAIGYDDTEAITVVELDEAGQTFFCAPTWKVEVSEELAILTPTFNYANGKGGAGIGGGSGSGKLKLKVVASLEEITNPKKGIIYLVPGENPDPEGTSSFDEYIYDGEKFELVGSYSVAEQIKSDILDIQNRLSTLESFLTTIDGRKTLIADDIKNSVGQLYISSETSN